MTTDTTDTNDPLVDLAADLEVEQRNLDDAVATLDDEGWARPTPAAGWAVRDQIAHLAASEDLAALAASDEDAFAAALAEASELAADDHAAPHAGRASLTNAALLAEWRARRAATIAAVLDGDRRRRIPWVAAAMSPMSFLTARLMETWAHGRDVFDALGTDQPATGALRHIAHLGVATRRFTYQNRGMEPPEAEVRVELTGPEGEAWTWGPPDATARVTGPAEDFCLAVTQRRAWTETSLEASGGAESWLAIAQAYAGPPTDPP